MILSIQLVGGPTAILEYGGVRWLTDPTLSPLGEYAGLTKLTGPAVDLTNSEPVDVVLLSHHHHSDNLDPAGREFLRLCRACSRRHARPMSCRAMSSVWNRGQRWRYLCRMGAAYA